MMKHFSWVAVALAACVPLASATANAATAAASRPASRKALLDGVIDRALAEGRIAGTVVIVMQNGKTVYERYAGKADIAAKTPVRPDTIFRLASVSKSYATAAALRLVEQGKLGLDDPVTKYLPDFKPKLADGTSPTITIRQLLSHSAGLGTSFAKPDEDPARRARSTHISLDERIRQISDAGLTYAPGKGWTYSTGLDVIGSVIEKITKKPFGAAMRELVTGPLGLKDTGFLVTDPTRLAVAYRNSPEGPKVIVDNEAVDFKGQGTVSFVPSSVLDPTVFPSGTGGMVGTGPEFVRFLETIRAGGKTFLHRATVAQMLTNQVGAYPTLMGPGWGFGLGGALLVDKKTSHTPQSVGTLSWGGAYGNSFFIDPKQGLTVIAFSNTAPEGDSGPFVNEIRDAAYGYSKY